MVLSSQSPRIGVAPRYVTTRRRKRQSRLWLAGLLVVALGAGGLYWMIDRFTPQSSEAASPSASTSSSSGSTASGSTASTRAAGVSADSGSSAGYRSASSNGAAPGRAWSAGSANSGNSGDSAPTSNTVNAGHSASVTERPRGSEVPGIRASGADAGSPGLSGSDLDSTGLQPSALAGSAEGTSRSDRSTGVNARVAPAGPVRSWLALLDSGDPSDALEARRSLSALLFDPEEPLAEQTAQLIRDRLTEANQVLVFSPRIIPGDEASIAYTVQPGDYLIHIARRHDLTHPFIERVNGIEARGLRAGQTIKLLNGPVHARVVKHDYLMDLYVLAGSDPIYICSFPVGLGENNSTPVGTWVVEPKRKILNPSWTDPRSGRYFAADDPDNPLGGYWIALQGADERTMDKTGYGIHGTIDPQSIGADASLGCIRLRDGDIELVYELLVEGRSTVDVLP